MYDAWFHFGVFLGGLRSGFHDGTAAGTVLFTCFVLGNLIHDTFNPPDTLRSTSREIFGNLSPLAVVALVLSDYKAGIAHSSFTCS